MKLGSFKLRPHHWGMLASILLSLALFSWAPFGMNTQRELFFDSLTRLGPKPATEAIVVVDLAGFKADKWNRADLAELVEQIASKQPSAMVFDLVFSSRCGADMVENRTLADALEKAPSILGFLVGGGENGKPRPAPPVLTARPLAVPDFWFLSGVEAPCPVFMDSASAAAASFLVGDADARVRRIQAFSITAGTAYPALSLEAARRMLGAGSPPIIGGLDLWLKLGKKTISLTEDGGIRFVASDRETIAKRTVSAADIMKNAVDTQRLAEKLVFIGSSAPVFGGLRESATMPLEPSVQIHADAAISIAAGFVPLRDYRFARYEALYLLFAGVFLAFAATRLQPAYLAALGVGLIVFSLAASLAIYATTAYLTDGFSVSIALGLVLAITTFFQFAHSRRTERLAHQRFGQYLPQSVVSRYLEGDELSAQERQVTALFTDIEGFSSLAKRMPPQELVGLLDTYFSEVNALIAASGGMIDKVVGDAVHALFNAPEDLDAHVDAAVVCAGRIRRLTEEMRKRPQFAAHAFGRTRIGIETGLAVIGEVGAGGKLDYTAHGDAINLAARLQEANKFLGTSICVGPSAARECSLKLRALGEHDIRGFGRMQLFALDETGAP
ncbi:adenylate/guanylate cyclase domain-containing protein [Rhizobium sp. L1K21]|uniref:adenylate/guanylate cyclase domain-containing protein n=1 Tax=Rhizobium sp. L1K21 TaxID=2954933 RepID=UPI002092791E|nr:adenylate/guanylate cyclase domain-containing protein [Rhizobium sp. L1K21]MCO6187521.1 adenylate/guanylate cyclase domain-containing protein [Rhizobium sp. L1K21]